MAVQFEGKLLASGFKRAWSITTGRALHRVLGQLQSITRAWSITTGTDDNTKL
jgi:hypothetical protein